MLLSEVVETSAAVAAARSRLVKISQIASLLRQAAPAEVEVVVAFLSGELRQRQIGVGYAAIASLDGRARAGSTPATPLTVTETDAIFAEVGAVTGAGAQARRRSLLAGMFGRAAPAESDFLAHLLAGELRQGAQEGVMVEAVARAADVPAGAVRRAHLLGGSLAAVAAAALNAGRDTSGRADPGAAAVALAGFGLQVGRPLRPMLASAAPTVAAALGRIAPAALEWKIDGIRIQVHRNAARVAVYTRTLDDITARVPEVCAAALSLSATSAVLDGEAIALAPDGRPLPFQVTAGRAGTQSDVARQSEQVPLTAFFFDLLHLDGTDLVDTPASERYRRLTEVAPAELVIPRLVTDEVGRAEAFFAEAIAQGHEGVVVKAPTACYAAGRRGGDWIKVKPRHTADLVVLAAEWGHGRRRGWLSNLHLAARDPSAGGLVMLGKTFKGLTDEMLEWQTRRLLELADTASAPQRQDGRPGGAPYGIVRVRPELVVEVAFDGVQASPRYPGGLALRFARVLRYREDKLAAEADTIDALRALWPGTPAAPAV